MVLKSELLSRRAPPLVDRRPSVGKFRSAVRWVDAVEWGTFWAFIGALAWCPYYYGGNDLLAWGVNGILFPGLAVIYEASLLVRRRPHPVGVREFKISALFFVAVVLWILIQNATWTPAFLHHPIWAMAADALGR